MTPIPDDAPWLNLTPEEVEELRKNKKQLTEYGKEKIRKLMNNQEPYPDYMFELATEREQANKDLEIIENAAAKAADILHISLPPEINKTRFVYFYTLLYNLMGEDDENMIHWLNTHNHHLGYCPATRLSDEQSLNDIVSYLESFL